MILGKRDVRTNPQGLRHEWVTLLMLRHLRNWLFRAVDANDLDFTFVEWAVVGHHPGHENPPTQNPQGAGPRSSSLWGTTIFGPL